MKIIPTSILSVLFFAICFLGNQNGPAATSGIVATGAPNETRSCNECHSGGSFNTSFAIEFFNEEGTTAVNAYIPSQVYTIRLNISVSGAPVGYGFQMIDIRKSNNSNIKGFTDGGVQAAGIRITQLNNREYIEQNRRLTTKIVNLKWRAPSTNVGAIVFYGIVNAVNGNSDSSGDSPSDHVSLEIPAATTPINELAENVHFNFSPNPILDELTINLMSDKARIIQLHVRDIKGSLIMRENWQVITGDNKKRLDLNTLPKGAYMIQVTDNQNVITEKIIKI